MFWRSQFILIGHWFHPVLSRLPVFQTLYSGSLNDVSTSRQHGSGLRHNPRQSAAGDGQRFLQHWYIDAMLGDPNGIRFIITLPFTMSFAKKQVQSERKDIDRIENALWSDGSFVGRNQRKSWNKDHSLMSMSITMSLLQRRSKRSLLPCNSLAAKSHADPETIQYRA